MLGLGDIGRPEPQLRHQLQPRGELVLFPGMVVIFLNPPEKTYTCFPWTSLRDFVQMRKYIFHLLISGQRFFLFFKVSVSNSQNQRKICFTRKWIWGTKAKEIPKKRPGSSQRGMLEAGTESLGSHCCAALRWNQDCLKHPEWIHLSAALNYLFGFGRYDNITRHVLFQEYSFWLENLIFDYRDELLQGIEQLQREREIYVWSVRSCNCFGRCTLPTAEAGIYGV